MKNDSATKIAKRVGCFAAPIAKSAAKCLNNKAADVAELVDARDLKSHARPENLGVLLQNIFDFLTEINGTKRDLQNISPRAYAFLNSGEWK